MAKRERERIIDVSGGADVDDRGKFRNKDADDGSGRSASKVKKKKKVKTVEREAVVIEDNTYKVGQEKKKKKRAASVDSPLKSDKKKLKKSKLGKTIEGEVVRIPDSQLPAIVGNKKTAKKRAQMVEAIEESVTLPPPVDEYDREYRRMFENSEGLAQRLEEQMEERIYNRDVYALNTIYSQIREIIADLRATRDISAQIAELESTVIGPYHKVVGQALSAILFHVEGTISKFVKDGDLREEIIKKLKNTIYESAVDLQEEYGKAVDRAGKVLL